MVPIGLEYWLVWLFIENTVIRIIFLIQINCKAIQFLS